MGGRNLGREKITKILRYLGQAIFVFGEAINLIANSALMMVIIFFVYTVLRGAGVNGKEAANTALNIISGNELLLAVLYIAAAMIIMILIVGIEDGKRRVKNGLNIILGIIAFVSFAMAGWLSAGSMVGKLVVIIWVISFVAIGWYTENKK
ncbi:hypothetical protein A3L01_05570 [Thermococcus barossii]|uniref:Uncharacterized protein n=2 Tax=Thermococcus barossii TaxID=54077 RepID=A0A2Z2MSG7_9EURY|nr:hypothetical protein A3L01_05570 [Thermococcus barossii]